MERLPAAIAGPIIAMFRGTSYPNICSPARIPPIVLNRFVETHAPMNTRRAISDIMNMTTIRSPSKNTNAERLSMGMQNRGVIARASIRIGVATKGALSALPGVMSSFDRSLTKSATG